MNIGIMGGTFNPIHNGHIVIAKSVADQLALDSVFFTPAGNPNFKRDQELAAAGDRVAMVERVIADEPLFQLDLREVERDGVTYTADTLEELAVEYPAAHFFFIMGTDSAITLPKWHRAGDVARLATIVVAQRPGESANEARFAIDTSPHDFDVIYLDVPQVDVSSTQVRDAIAAGADISEMVPPQVGKYIEEHGLYR